MNYQWIATPIVGALIGYSTNWVAIKMLFRPYTQKRFLGINIPFTPGLIPKERHRIAGAIGGVVEQYLLTDEVIVKELTSEAICSAIVSMLEEELGLSQGYLDLSKIFKDPIVKEKVIKDFSKMTSEKVTTWSIEKTTRDLFLPKMKALVIEYLSNQDIKSLLQKNEVMVNTLISGLFSSENRNQLAFMLEGYMNQEKTLSEFMGPEMIEQIHGVLVVNEPKMKQALKDLLGKETVASGAKEMISSVIASKFGALGAMFANPDSIYESIVVAFNEKLDTTQLSSIVFGFLEENMSHQVLEWVPEETRKVLASQISERLMSEGSKKWVAAQLEGIEETPYEWLNRLTNRQIDPLIEQVIESIFDALTKNQDKVQSALENNMRYILQTIIEKPIQVSSQMRTKATEMVLKAYQSFVKKYVVKMVQTARLSSIVEKQINTFEIHMLEDIILAIAKKELNAITWLGALLGFIMSIVLLFLK